MLGLIGLRNRHQRNRRTREHERAALSGVSDHESERVGSSRRKRRRKGCSHDPGTQALAEWLTDMYHWLLRPMQIRNNIGNGLEQTSWERLCSNEKSILIAMCLFRLLNFCVVQTYYVADEYWQSLEVAHRQVFGDGYLTWEWMTRIRSYFYPSVFALIYKLADIMSLDSFFVLTKLPRILQAMLYAVSDLYLFKLSSKLAGPLVAQWTLLCNCLNWFVFYCATRTLTNTCETALTVIGLYHYPWSQTQRPVDSWKFLWIAALSVMVRPTAAIIWLPLCTCHIWKNRHQLWKTFTLYYVTGGLFIIIMLRVDKVIYGDWTFVPFNFLYYNVFKQLSHAYGTHPWHWYFTQGLPFILSTHVILLLIGWKRCRDRALQLLLTWTVLVYSSLAHKEFRFVLPVLPLMMHVCGYGITTIYQVAVVNKKNDEKIAETFTESQISDQVDAYLQQKKKSSEIDHDSGLTTSELSDSLSDSEIADAVRQRFVSSRPSAYSLLTPRRIVLLLILGNAPMALYFSLLHQRGAMEVVQFLHHESQIKSEMSSLFLMPCHSTPYYSHIHTNITMRFLTCEPNLDRNPDYVDEAEEFHNEPIKWLKQEVVKGPNKHVYSHVVMFDSLEPKVEKFLVKGRYVVCAHFFYSHFTENRRSRYIKVYCRNKTA